MDSDAMQGARLAATQADATHNDASAPVGAQSGVEDASAAMSADEIGAERLESDEGERPTVESRAWLKQDDYWQRTTYIAVTGRHTASAPPTRPLPRPHRFRKSSRVRSLLTLALTLALIVVIPVGVLLAQHAAETHIKLPTSIPGLTAPTPTHTPAPTVTAKPTPTPKKK